MPALRRPDPEPELEPEKEDVNAPNIAVEITQRLLYNSDSGRVTDCLTKTQSEKYLKSTFISSLETLHTLPTTR